MNQPAFNFNEIAPIGHLCDPRALFVANHSGGKDSQAMLIMLSTLLRDPSARANLIVVHASLGDVEWPGALEHAQKQAEDLGAAFIIARARRTFLQMVEERHAARPEVPSWPSAKHRQCTSDLKRGPITREVRAYAKKYGYTTIVNCMGMRAEESAARAKKAAWTHNLTNSIPARMWFDWLPIHTLTTSEVFETIRSAGQEPHPAYALGNERLSCVFCIMGSANDAAVGRKHNPELFARYAELEARTGYTMHQSRKSLTVLADQGCAS